MAAIRRNGALTLVNNFDRIPMDTVIHDPDGLFDSVNGRLVIKRPGHYRITGECYGTGPTAGTYMLLSAYVNGTEVKVGSSSAISPGVGTVLGTTISAILPFAIGDGVDLGYQKVGGNVALTISPKLNYLEIEGPL